MRTLLARILLIVSAALVPALGFQAWTEMNARLTRNQMVENEALRFARLVSAEQQRIAEGAEQVLDTLGASPAVLEGKAGDCQHLLANMVRKMPRYRYAAVIGLDGREICAPGPPDQSVDVSDRAFFRRALQTGGFVIGDYAVGVFSGDPAVHMAEPFADRDGAVGGVVVVALSLEWLGEQLKRLDLPPAAVASVVDRNGIVLARYPAGAGFVGQPIPDANRFTLAATKPGVFEMASQGHPLIVAYSPPADEPKGLLIKVGLDRNITFGAAADANRIGFLLIAAGGVLALAVTALLGTRLIRQPVQRLLRTADRWRTGDLAARTGLLSDRSEFGRLATAFDDMASAHQSRDRALRTALESTTDSVMVLDRGWRFTYLNQNAKAQISQGQDLIGRVIWDAFPGTEDGVFGNAYRNAVEQGLPTLADGFYAPLGTHFEAHAYPSDEGLTVFFRDVTGERRTAAALRQTEEDFRATFEQAAVGMAQVGLDGRWLRVNDKLCAITGYTRAEMLGSGFAAITHPEDLAGDVAQTSALIGDGGAVQVAEKRYVRKGGDVVWVNRTISLLRDGAGRPERIIAVVEDITARRRMEEALRESEARLQLAREAAGFGVWDWDLAGDMIWSDEQWLLHGRVPQPGCPDRGTLRTSVHPDDRKHVLDGVRSALADPALRFSTEYRTCWPDGTVRWLLAKATVVRGADGKPVRMVGLAMDVTESRETEATLRRLSEGLEARVREEVAAREAAQARAAYAERIQALGQLAGGIAHDFNNVLQAIYGSATLIERHPGDTAGVTRLARIALEAAERGASTTRRLLSFGRRADLRTEAIDAGALLGGLREILSHTLGAGIDLHVRHGNGVPPLLADKGQLETAMVNLATNARDAMPGGGRLTFSAEAETVRPGEAAEHPGGLSPGRYVRLAAADTGTGMDAATLARAGEPFFTTKDVGLGTGLGLPMAKGFAEQSGGALRVESSLGKGTVVTLWLPAAGPVHSPPHARMDGQADGSGGPAEKTCVLLVDDEDLVREVLAEQLQDAGYGVIAVADGAEALAILSSGAPVDALVTDLAMPGMDGLAVIRAAQERCPGLPAVLLTGYAGDGASLAVSGAVTGTFSLLRKPVSGVQLIDRIRALLISRESAVR
jgi:PAS domain S-box-containing protein